MTRELRPLLSVIARSDGEMERRFWSLVDKRGPDDCWEWSGTRNHAGYGHLYFGMPYRANRVSFVLAFGWEPPAVLHKCDNPPCVNPRHLFGGTNSDNMLDCAAKYRMPRQIKPPLRSTILALAETGMSHRAIARQVGVGRTAVNNIVKAVAS